MPYTESERKVCQTPGTIEFLLRSDRNQKELNEGRIRAKQAGQTDPMTKGKTPVHKKDTGVLNMESEEDV